MTGTGRTDEALPDSVLGALAERLLRHPWRCWFYGDSIGFEGLLAATELLGEARYAAFAHGFLRAWATRDLPYRPDDNTAPGHQACTLALRTGDGELRTALIRLGEHLAGRRQIGAVPVTFEDAGSSLREPYGGVPLPDDERRLLRAPGAGVYVDCLHFDPPFYAHLWRLTGDRAWAGRAVATALGSCELLADPTTGLYHHFWLEETGRGYGLGWGRGQGWALLGLLDTLELVEADEPGRDALVRRAKLLAEAMRDRQLLDGSWPAIAQLPDSGPEASTAAFMAAGFARGIALGVLPAVQFQDAADGAWRATLARLDDSERLADVSAAVYSSTALGHYAHVPLGFDVPWGLGPVLVAALERRPSRERP